jgi:TPR repeat protein
MPQCRKCSGYVEDHIWGRVCPECKRGENMADATERAATFEADAIKEAARLEADALFEASRIEADANEALAEQIRQLNEAQKEREGNRRKEREFEHNLDLARRDRDENHHAASRVGWAYENGHGVHKDSVEALKWYKKAATWGNCNALERIALAILNGELGYTADAQKSVPWFEKAEKAGSAAAKKQLEKWRQEWAKQATFAEQLKLAEAGSGTAANYVAWAYETGYGVKGDTKGALKWYEKAAASGNCNALERIALAILNGELGYTVDAQKSVPWFEKAEKAGSAAAKKQLDEWRQEWAKQATFAEQLKLAEAGSGAAANYVAWAYETGYGVKKDISTAGWWCKYAVHKGNTDAILMMAKAFVTPGWEQIAGNAGNTRPQNLSAAIKWAQEAKLLGSQEAQTLIDEWSEKLTVESAEEQNATFLGRTLKTISNWVESLTRICS